MEEFSPPGFSFAGLQFIPETARLISANHQKIIELTPFEKRFLLILVRNPGTTVHYEELRMAVWAGGQGKIESKAQTLKRSLIKKIELCGADGSFIQAVPKKGYRLAIAVETSASPATSVMAETGATDHRRTGELRFPVFGKYAGFTLTVSIIYAILLWLALLLEVAYRFDLYGATALRLSFPLVAFMFAATFGSLRRVEIAAAKRQPNGWLGGLFVFILANGTLCGALLAFLPTVPVTLLREATAQPAFAAFLKNVILYFLPMFIFFVFLPFYATVAPRQKPLLRVRLLTAIWGMVLLYSIITHFLMLDRLQPAPFQNLFIALIFLRFVGYFGLAIIGVIWFYQNAETAKPEETLSQGIENTR